MDTAETVHVAWRDKRDAALTEFFAGFETVEDWSSLAVRPPPEAASDNRLWIGFVTMAATCVNAHAAAAQGYFNLAALTNAGNSPSAAGRLWYTRSLEFARLAENDSLIASAAYCLGCIEADEGARDTATAHFLTTREHAEKAGHPAGKSAAAFRLALLAMADDETKPAVDYAMESYIASRDAGQFGPAVETLSHLFEYCRKWSFDDLATKPAVDVLSTLLMALVAKKDVERNGAAFGTALRAIALLRSTVREEIVDNMGERFGAAVRDQMRIQLDTLVAGQTQQE
jgi:hypothetical protein